MDLDFIRKAIPMYQEAAFLVLRIGGIGIIFAFTIGLIISIVRYYKLPVLSQVFEGYIELSRNTPLMIQLFFLVFWFAASRHPVERRSLRHVGVNLFGRQLLCGSDTRWFGIRPEYSDGISVQSGFIKHSNFSVRYFPAGNRKFISKHWSEHHLFAEGNLRVQRNRISRLGFCRKRYHGLVLQN